MNEKEHFIKRFKEAANPTEIENCFLHGNCYWFAKILIDRFIDCSLYYLPIENHFIVRDINGDFYDIRGKIAPSEKPYFWRAYKMLDHLETERIIRDCINKEF